MDPTSFPPDTGKQRGFITKGIFKKVKLVVICIRVCVIMQGVVQTEEEILIFAVHSSQLRGCGARTGVRRHLLSLN